MSRESESTMMTITTREYQRLVAKSKSGWKAFYELFQNVNDLTMNVHHHPDNVHHDNVHHTHRREKDTDEDPTYLKMEYVRLLHEARHVVSCPVCLENLDTNQNVIVLNCGHLLCRNDHTAIVHGPESQRMCPTCRRRIR